jgi:protein-S-isoprenylcysteine O-methyltransferase Ste14
MLKQLMGKSTGVIMAEAAVIGVIAILALADSAFAHGFIPDGHERGLSVLDYIELGGIILASVGLIVFSIFGKEKPPKK